MPLDELLQNLKASLETLGQLTPPPESGSEEEKLISRLLSVLGYLQARLVTADQRLISHAGMSNIEGHYRNIQEQLTGYYQNRGGDNVGAIHQGVDNLLTEMAHIPQIPWNQPPEVAATLTESIRNEVAGLKVELERQKEESTAIAEQLQTVLSTSKGILEQMEAESGKTVESMKTTLQAGQATLSETVSGLQEQAQRHVQRLDQAVSTINDQFATSQQDRVTAFSTAQEERRQSLQASTESMTSMFQQLFDEHRTTGQQLIDYLQQTANTAEEILGVTSASATADAYLRDAEQQRREADRWRIIVGVSLLATAITAYLTLKFLNPPGQGSWLQFSFFYLSRTFLVGAIAAFAAFAVRETNLHRSRERESKRLANELTTFRPFLAELDTDERNALIKEASKRYFPGHQT